MNSLLDHLALMLKMLNQPVKVRQLSESEVLVLGPYRSQELKNESCRMAICSRRETQAALLGTPSVSTLNTLDFHVHFPVTIPVSMRQELVWMLLHINRVLPIGHFQLLAHGRLVFLHELSLAQNPPPGLIIELIARLLYSFFQAAPLILKVLTYQLHPWPALAQMRFDPLPKGGTYWLLTTQHVKAHSAPKQTRTAKTSRFTQV